MKAVIVDLRNGQAAALCDDGRVVRLADPGYSLGQIVEVHEKKRRTPLWVRYASTAAAAALLLVGAGGGAAFAMPYGVVSLDVNPSLEYTINRFDYVLKVEGVNEDGKELLSRMDTRQIVRRRIGDALEASVQQLEAGDWLGGESGEILISAGTKQPEHAEKLLSALEDGLCSGREGLEVHGFAVSEAEISAAHREGMSAGRHRALDALEESEGADFARDDWADRPIRDIFSRLESGPAGAADREDTRPDAREDTLPAQGRGFGGSADGERGQQTQDAPSQQILPRADTRAGQTQEQPDGQTRPEPANEPTRPDGGFGGYNDGPSGMGGGPGGGFDGGPGGRG